MNLLCLLGPKPERRRALLFSLGFIFVFLVFLTIRAFLGGLTWSKTLENLQENFEKKLKKLLKEIIVREEEGKTQSETQIIIFL